MNDAGVVDHAIYLSKLLYNLVWEMGPHCGAIGNVHDEGLECDCSYALYNPGADYAVIVLFNRTVGDTSITDAIGMHLDQRLRGVKAIALR